VSGHCPFVLLMMMLGFCCRLLPICSSLRCWWWRWTPPRRTIAAAATSSSSSQGSPVPLQGAREAVGVGWLGGRALTCSYLSVGQSLCEHGCNKTIDTSTRLPSSTTTTATNNTVNWSTKTTHPPCGWVSGAGARPCPPLLCPPPGPDR